jgi:phosphate:Na+ symporter
MGANIGTTVTAWLVSWLGFKADISILAVPLMLLGFLFSNSKKNQRQNIGELIVGFCLLFLGLSFMKNSVPDLNETPQVLEFVRSWAGHGFGSVLIFLVFGTVLTLVLQSSSATMAITLIMLSMGFIPFEMACAMVLGENIGTTITANIAAAVGNTQAKRAAMSHTIFNVFGVIWALILFKPFLSLVGKIIEVVFGHKNAVRQAALFEYNALGGRLLVCTLNLEKDDPACRYMRAAIIRYMQGKDFAPRQALDREQLRKLIHTKTKMAAENTNLAFNINDKTAKRRNS